MFGIATLILSGLASTGTFDKVSIIKDLGQKIRFNAVEVAPEPKPTVASATTAAAPAPANPYPVHDQITTTVFWVGEEASAANGYISNTQSAWDSSWLEHFGDPQNPKENPFYVALPYNDLDDLGVRRENAQDVVYWGHEKNWSKNESMVKNRWVKISKNNLMAYAQWEDAGPFVYDDDNYVFGTSRPQNRENSDAGLDVSPAVRDYLGLRDIDQVSWQFIDASYVPNGPWKEIITTSQISFD